MAVAEASGSFNIGRVIQRTIGLVGRNFVPFSVLSLLLAGAPYFLLLLMVPTMMKAAMTGGNPAALSNISYVSTGIGIIYFLGALVLQAALTRASVDDLSRRPVSISTALRTAVAALLPMLGLMLVYLGVAIVGAILFSLVAAAGVAAQSGLVMGLAGIAFVVVAVYVLLRWLVSIPVLVVERPGVFASLRRSSALTVSHRWAILGLMILYVIFLLVLELLIALVIPGGPTMMMTGAGAENLAMAPIVILVLMQSIMTMIITAAVASIYFELRQIKDGIGVTELADVFS